MSYILGNGMRRDRNGIPNGSDPHVGDPSTGDDRRSGGADHAGGGRGAQARARATWVVCWVVWAALAVAIVVWLLALRGTNLNQTGGLGLVNAFPTTYYIAIAICVAAIVASLVWSTFSRLACGSGLSVFILLIFGTPPMVYSQPEYAWMYKHLGVIEYLMAHGATNRAIDIYQNWPGLFAANALLASASGVHPIDYAAWAPVVFELALIGAVLFALGGAISSDRRRYAVAFVWICGSWIGQDYLSPQAVSIVMVVAILGVVVRIGTAGGWDAPARSWVGRLGDGFRATSAGWISRLVRRPPGAGDHRTQLVPRARITDRERTVGVALIIVLGLAVITSHQLSPVNLMFDLGVVALFCAWRRLWAVIVVLGVVEVAWVALAWPFVARFGLVSFGGPVSPPVSQGVPLAGVAVVQDGSRAMGVIFWVFALIGVVRMLRRVGGDPETPAIFGAFALAPYLVVPIQSYGGEVTLRAYLFSLPWMAALALEAIWPSGSPARSPDRVTTATMPTAGPSERGWWRRPGLRERPWGLAILTPVLVSGLILTYFGYSLTNWMTPSDVEAATWVETHLPAHATVLFFGPGFPNKLTAQYPLYRYYPLTITDTPSNVFGLQTPGQRVATVRTALAAVGVKTAYLIVSPSMLRYEREEGIISQADISATIHDLLAAPDITTVYNRDGSYVFAYTVK